LGFYKVKETCVRWCY